MTPKALALSANLTQCSPHKQNSRLHNLIPARLCSRSQRNASLVANEVQTELHFDCNLLYASSNYQSQLSPAPKSELAGARFRFEADRLSPMQIRALAEKKLNKKIDVRYVDFEENKKKFDTDFMAFLTTIFEDGRGAVGTPEEVAATAAKYFPDWNPAKYETFIQ